MKHCYTLFRISSFHYARAYYQLALLITLRLILSFGAVAEGSTTNHFHWNVEYVNVTRLCETRSIVTVNGKFPGPTMYVNEGDHVLINITNLVPSNITIHWHGVRQLLTAWADGLAYITQCPIQQGKSYVHKFQIVDQRGTLFWHAHISWLRATVHGAIIIRPKPTLTTPFNPPTDELPPIILGEWWNADVEAVIEEALSTGRGYNHSNARTINGQPGYPSNCSTQEMTRFNVTKGHMYMLHLINAALNVQMYFSIANHTMTIVEADGEYTKPFRTDVVILAPGQTNSVIMKADKAVSQYLMVATVFSPANDTLIPYLPTPTSALLHYNGAQEVEVSTLPFPTFPAYDDKYYASNFTKSLKGQYESKGYFYYNLPMKIDYDLFYTLSYITQPFSDRNTLMTAINNITFKDPTISLLEAYYYNISGVYDTDFPNNPPYPFDYTSANEVNNIPTSVLGTKVKVLEFNKSVQLVFQDTSTFAIESHPIHLHGTNFYIVGTGFGNYNATTDPANFNLHDPPSRNTIAVPSGGWAAIRFTTTNPGSLPQIQHTSSSHFLKQLPRPIVVPTSSLLDALHNFPIVMRTPQRKGGVESTLEKLPKKKVKEEKKSPHSINKIPWFVLKEKRTPSTYTSKDSYSMEQLERTSNLFGDEEKLQQTLKDYLNSDHSFMELLQGIPYGSCSNEHSLPQDMIQDLEEVEVAWKSLCV